MNRIEFMEALSGLLQDIPEEDRMDALKYYNDYFENSPDFPSVPFVSSFSFSASINFL